MGFFPSVLTYLVSGAAKRKPWILLLFCVLLYKLSLDRVKPETIQLYEVKYQPMEGEKYKPLETHSLKSENIKDSIENQNLNSEHIEKSEEDHKLNSEHIEKSEEDHKLNTKHIEKSEEDSDLNSDPIEERMDVRCGCGRVFPGSGGAGAGDVLGRITRDHGESTCSDTATMRGPGQMVVSYATYGVFPSEYFGGLQKVAAMVATLYPGWVMRVYYGNVYNRHRKLKLTYQEFMCNLTCTYSFIDFCHVEQLPGNLNITAAPGTVWRYAVIGDPLVSRYIIRDTDSLMLQREVDAVNHWISLGTCYHLMRDHPRHKYRIMAGMWGGCNSWRVAEARAARDALMQQSRSFSDDQKIAVVILLPVMEGNMTEHDSYGCTRFPGSLPFPSQRVNDTFIGNANLRRCCRRGTISKVCPEQCRPKDHQDWTIC